MKIEKFVLGMAEKAGIPITDARLAGFLAIPAIREIDIPDDIEQQISRSLLSIEDAKNNHPAIKTHYFAEIMNNVDRSLESIYQDAGFTSEEIAELNSERSSTKRIPLVAQKLKKKLEAQLQTTQQNLSSNANAKVQELTNKVNELNELLAKTKETLKEKESEFTNKLKEFKINNSLNAKYAALKTIYDTLPENVRMTTLSTIVNSELQDNGARFDIDDNGALVLRRKDGTNFFDENNRQLSVEDFINRVASKNKILIQNSALENGNNITNQSGEQQGRVNGNNSVNQKNNTKVVGLFNERIHSLENKNPTSIV